MRARMVIAAVLGLGVLLMLTFVISLVRPDLTGGRSYGALTVGAAFLGYGISARKQRAGANPSGETPPRA